MGDPSTCAEQAGGQHSQQRSARSCIEAASISAACATLTHSYRAALFTGTHNKIQTPKEHSKPQPGW